MIDHIYEICKSDHQVAPDLLWVGGRSGVGLAQRDLCDLRKDGSLVWQAAILWQSSCSPFQSQVVWKEASAALFGAHDEVYALDICTGAVIIHKKLGAHFSYFGSFEIDSSRRVLFVLTGTEILCFDRQLREIWSTNGLAVDGVVCRRIGDAFLTVDAEMDPPGGWDRVTIDLTTGKELSRRPAPMQV